MTNVDSPYKKKIEYMSGALFKKLRKENKLTMQKAAEIIGINKRTIQRWESSGAATQAGYKVLFDYIMMHKPETEVISEAQKFYNESAEVFNKLSKEQQLIFTPDPRALTAAPAVDRWFITSDYSNKSDPIFIMSGIFSDSADENSGAVEEEVILTIDGNGRFFYSESGTLYRLDDPVDQRAECKRLAAFFNRVR